MTIILLSRLVLTFQFVSSFQKPSLSPPRGTILASSMTREFTAEVVGASGRMGTFFLQHGCDTNTTTSDESVVACPRGMTPGSQTPEGSPIYVATPSDAYLPIYEATPVARRKDLVLCGNAGLPIDERFEKCTILVPHFSVLYQDQWKGESTSSETDNGIDCSRKIQVNTDPLVSPPTYIYGKHAAIAAEILEANGIATKIVASFGEIKAYSGRKLVWASCFWLLCHSYDSAESDSEPLTVGQVHVARQDDLEKLVDEILPSLRDLLICQDDDEQNERNQSKNNEALGRIIERTRVLEYLKAYSTSISGAVPSIALAKQEFHDRNAVWLSNHRHEQPFHIELLTRMGVDVGSVTLSEDE